MRSLVISMSLLAACSQMDAPIDPMSTPDLAESMGPDVKPPVFAGAQSATAAPNSITVRWSAASDDVSAPAQLVYRIYQATAAGGEVYSAPSYTTLPGATSYTVGKLPINSKYYFVVRAVDEAGNEDQNKLEVSATTPAISDMQAPTFAGLTSATANGSSVTLSWSAASDQISAPAALTYLVYQATTSGGQSYAMPTYTTAPGATMYVTPSLTANQTYYFVVRAQDEAGNVSVNTVERSAKTTGVSFSTQVQPIFTASCTGNGCHSGASPAQGLNLSSAAVSHAALVNVASQQCPTTKRVMPQQPDASYLVWKLQGSGACFSGSRMPKGQALTAAEQSTIRSWITAGALLN